MKKLIFLVFLAALGGYWLLLKKPALYYGETKEYKNFTLMARDAVPEGTEAALDRALDKISKSEFFTPDAKFTIYLTAGAGELHFFAPFITGEYTRVSPLSGGIFLAPGNFKQDKIQRATGEQEFRFMNQAIAGGVARELVRRKLEALTYVFKKDWEIAGYAERIAGSSDQFTPQDICKDAPDGSALSDYQYGLAVGVVMDQERMPFSELLNRNYSYEGFQSQLKRRFCNK